MRWFGKSWGAPACDPKEKTETPLGEPCVRCGQKFTQFDRGVCLPQGNEPEFACYHLTCLRRALGLDSDDV